MGIKPTQSIAVATSACSIRVARSYRNEVKPAPKPYGHLQVARLRGVQPYPGPAKQCDLLKPYHAQRTKLLATSPVNRFALTENVGTVS